ncbi:MAG: PH domain-containing protein [Planctomycetota bacterium]
MRLQTDEEVLHEVKPAPRLLVLWLFTRCLPAPLVIAAVIFGATLANTETLGPALVAGCATFAALFLAVLTYNACLVRTYVYYVTNQRCVFHGGILRLVEHSVPYHKITDVETSRNILERALSIATVNLFTPGTSSSGGRGSGAELSFPGLEDPESPVDSINDILRFYRATGE